jgi:hypothetical protein
MDLFAQAKAQGIQTEFLDGQGHRRVTDAAALKIILDALPPQAPGPLIGHPVVGGARPAPRTHQPPTNHHNTQQKQSHAAEVIPDRVAMKRDNFLFRDVKQWLKTRPAN